MLVLPLAMELQCSLVSGQEWMSRWPWELRSPQDWESRSAPDQVLPLGAASDYSAPEEWEQAPEEWRCSWRWVQERGSGSACPLKSVWKFEQRRAWVSESA